MRKNDIPIRHIYKHVLSEKDHIPWLRDFILLIYMNIRETECDKQSKVLKIGFNKNLMKKYIHCYLSNTEFNI